MNAHSRLVFLSLLDADVSPEHRVAAHNSWALRFGIKEQRHAKRNHAKLRIAYLGHFSSGETRSRLIGPVVRAHNREAFTVYSYGFAGGDVSRPASGMQVSELCSAIASDRIDILVDTDGHFHCSSMELFAARPAPLLVSLGAYPFPRGLEGALHIENPLMYGPPRFSPAIRSAHPCAENGFLTFACFSEPIAVSPGHLQLFAEIVASVKGSRFVFLLPHGAEERSAIEFRLRQPFGERGIDPGRVAVAGPLAEWDRLNLLNEVDFLLDTQPFSQTAATLDGLWMGVPSLTSEGADEPGRGSATVLRRCGLEEFVAPDEEALRTTAVNLAQELRSRADLRSGIAARFRASGLCDQVAGCRSLEFTLTEAWASISE